MPRSLPPQVQPALALKDSSTPRPALTYVVSGPGWSDPLPPKPKYPAPGSSASCDCCGGTTKEFHHCEGCDHKRSDGFDLCAACYAMGKGRAVQLHHAQTLSRTALGRQQHAFRAVRPPAPAPGALASLPPGQVDSAQAQLSLCEGDGVVGAVEVKGDAAQRGADAIPDGVGGKDGSGGGAPRRRLKVFVGRV